MSFGDLSSGLVSTSADFVGSKQPFATEFYGVSICPLPQSVSSSSGYQLAP
jgi:hypothetical protein